MLPAHPFIGIFLDQYILVQVVDNLGCQLDILVSITKLLHIQFQYFAFVLQQVVVNVLAYAQIDIAQDFVFFLVLVDGLVEVPSHYLDVLELGLDRDPKLTIDGVIDRLLLEILVQGLDLLAHILKQKVADVVGVFLLQHEHIQDHLVNLDRLQMIFGKYFYPSQAHAVSLEPIALAPVALPRDLRVSDPRVAPLLVGHELTAAYALLAGGVVDVILGVYALGLRGHAGGIVGRHRIEGVVECVAVAEIEGVALLLGELAWRFALVYGLLDHWALNVLAAVVIGVLDCFVIAGVVAS